MKLQERKALLARLGGYMKGNEEAWLETKQRAFHANNWFIPEFVQNATDGIADNFLNEQALDSIIDEYGLTEVSEKKVGIVMAGNIPLVGFHDLILVFLSGHSALVKLSSKDDVLIRHLIGRLHEWEPRTEERIMIGSLLRDCDAYIATGSNNSSRYFDYYFKDYPSIIRRNRTSAAIIDGSESEAELQGLADDVYLYFGLGCRNVTKIYVPQEYDFVPLLEAFRKWDHLMLHNKYKNNYDYNLAVLLLNHQFYMTNGSILLVESEGLFSPISQLHYEYYTNADAVRMKLVNDDTVQCVTGHGALEFGTAQRPGLTDYADGVDTLIFLKQLGTGGS